MKRLLIALSLFFYGCVGPSNKTLKILINVEQTGWYFFEVIEDSSVSNTGTLSVRLDPTTRIKSVRINKIGNTILKPHDLKGNHLSARLKYLGILRAKGKTFIEFYNPTDEELANIERWLPTNSRALKIRLKESVEFSRQYSRISK